MNNDDAIRVQGLSKCYQIYSNPADRLKQFIFPRIKRLLGKPSRPYYREFWALENITFTVKRGETVGILGSNGSGKSTLLQIICGTLSPTGGSVQTQGRIAALLELGSGFNPDFTGKENVYLNAAVLGLTLDEINRRYDDIVNFAEIGDFINQPVKTYSSGMTVRLAFAVQSQIEPDILIVDEALSVGDAKFQAKCFDRLRQLKENGTSILLVTHSSEQIVSHCTQALLLNKGRQIELGEPKRIVNRYMDILFGKDSNTVVSTKNEPDEAKNPESEITTYVTTESVLQLNRNEDVFSTRLAYNPHEYRWGDKQAVILDYQLYANASLFPTAISTGQKIELYLAVKFEKTIFRPIFGITIKTKEGITVYGANTETLEQSELSQSGFENTVIVLKTAFECTLAQGDYFISLGIASKKGEEVIPHDRRYDSIHLQVRPNKSFFGISDMQMSINLLKS
jgi:lipopolysaccharide transport system ATP-binding protein